jgi:phage nucleotide-binding protein
MTLKRKPQEKGIASRIKPVHEAQGGLTAALYGRSGTGKTTIACTFPGPVLLLDISEQGTDSVSNVKDLDVLNLEGWKDFEDVYWYLKDEGHGYKTVVIDAMHSLQDLAIIDAKDQHGKEPEDKTSKQDFGVASGLLKSWMFNYRDLSIDGMNVVFIAHDRIVEMDDDSEDGQLTPEVVPRVMPSVSSALCGMVNVVGNTFVREEVQKPKKVGEKSKRVVQYCLRIGPHGYYTTKIRSPRESFIPDFLVDPDYDKIVEVVEGKVQPPPTTPGKTLPVRRRKS